MSNYLTPDEHRTIQKELDRYVAAVTRITNHYKQGFIDHDEWNHLNKKLCAQRDSAINAILANTTWS